MKKEKLSKLQISALQNAPLCFGQSEVDLNKYYWVNDNSTVDFTEKTVDSLLERGLLEKSEDSRTAVIAVITERGKDALHSHLMSGLKIGYVVKLKDGRVGMITWKKDNYMIGINIGHYNIVMSASSYKDMSEDEKRDIIISLGADDTWDNTDIVEIVRDNSIYKTKWKIR